MKPDVYVDKAGTVWFSYVTSGNLEDDMIRTEGGVASHFVEMDFWPRGKHGIGSKRENSLCFTCGCEGNYSCPTPLGQLHKR